MITTLPKPRANRIIKTGANSTEEQIFRRLAVPMTTNSRSRKLHRFATTFTAIMFAIIAMLAIVISAPLPANAQRQGSVPSPRLQLPANQGWPTSTLELPAVPRQEQQGGSLNIPPQVPQTGQELVIPSRQLREQPGYAQVTVTVTDPRGTYVTGLQKSDFKLYMDGQQRPIQFFRQDLNTPVSIGILVDTSGSMGPKILQARLAISQ